MRAHLLIALSCVLLPCSAKAQDKSTIQGLNDRFAAAFNSGDAAAVAAHYTEDATVLPPGNELVQGRSAIQAFWKGAIEQLGEIRLTAIDVRPLGSSAAREIGTFALKTKAQPPQEISGKYVVVWEKVGNDWKLATDIWNTNR